MIQQCKIGLLFLALGTFCSSVSIGSAETVCQLIEQKKAEIQGVVIYPDNTRGLLFAGERVFEFDPSNDFQVQGEQHWLYLRNASIAVEKYFEGVYLKGGNKIRNVYGTFTNMSRNIFFVMTNDNMLKEGSTISPGFSYDLDRRMSVEIETAVVPKQYPFTYFSDNGHNVYMYQIQVFTIQARLNFAGVDSTGYFAFNALDRRMEYFKVDGLSKVQEEDQKFIEVMSRKLLLRSGFIFKGYVYLITADSVYVVEQKEMQSNPMPNRTKIALDQFLKCSQDAILDPTDIGNVITIVLIVILGLVILALIAAFFMPNKSASPEDIVTRKSSGGVKRKSSGSKSSTSPTGT